MGDAWRIWQTWWIWRSRKDFLHNRGASLGPFLVSWIWGIRMIRSPSKQHWKPQWTEDTAPWKPWDETPLRTWRVGELGSYSNPLPFWVVVSNVKHHDDKEAQTCFVAVFCSSFHGIDGAVNDQVGWSWCLKSRRSNNFSMHTSPAALLCRSTNSTRAYCKACCGCFHWIQWSRTLVLDRGSMPSGSMTQDFSGQLARIARLFGKTGDARGVSFQTLECG